jgi:prepilin-type N-terminal cleavage/methylation domain-containing protein
MKEQGARSGEFGAKPGARGAIGGFTLLELLATVALIATIAGLFIAGMGYVNKKSALSKAQTEVAVLAAAIDNFKLEHGVYPADTNLFAELAGVTNGDARATINTNGKVYVEPSKSMVKDLRTGPFMDPWGNEYFYQTNEKTKEFRNVGFFDLWSTAGGTNDPEEFIHN